MSNEYTTTIDLGDIGERQVTVQYWYTPGCKANLWGPNPHPSSEEAVEIDAVIVRLGKYLVDVSELLSANAVTCLVEQISEHEREAA